MAEHVSIRGLEKTVNAMKEMGALAGKNGGPVKGALFAATRVICDEAVARAPIGVGTPSPGNLRKNIFIYRDRNPRASSGATERYIISVRTGRKGLKKFKIGGGTRALTGGDAWYWFFVEFGTSKMTGESSGHKPFMRPAFEAMKRRALVVFGRELRVGVEKLAQRQSRSAR